ncbi:MAG: hypothetical protein H6Q85_3163, partial [candidate division NC10 bacterium]|nr:hypothetical protein [candidate division NC10 bacterium]
MRRFATATWILGAAFAAGLLPGCADVIAEQGRVSADPRGASAPVRGDTRADRRAYYAYTRSVWAEIQGDLEAAVQWGREALRFDPSSRMVRNHLASVLLKKGDFRAAIHEGEEILAQSPNDVQAHLLLAAAFQGLRNVKGAERHYKEVIRLDPKRAEAYLFLGNLYAETRNFSEAASVFESLIRVNPRSYLAHYSL